MVKDYTKATHKYNHYPPTQRERLPYRHGFSQRGNTTAISFNQTTENHIKAQQYNCRNEKQPPESAGRLLPIRHEALDRYHYTRYTPYQGGRQIEISFGDIHCGLILCEVILLTKFLLLGQGQACEVGLPTRTKVDMPTPKTTNKRGRVLLEFSSHRAICTFVVCHSKFY